MDNRICSLQSSRVVSTVAPGRFGALCCFLLAGAQLALSSAAVGVRPVKATPQRCPPEMAAVRGFCIDRWEATMVDHASGAALSPYYPPHRGRLTRAYRVWQVERHQVGDEAARALPLPPVPEVQRRRFQLRAVSRPGVVPQAYLSHALAKRACSNAGKRLCTESEWLMACRGEQQRKFPYGDRFDLSGCNVYRYTHPAYVLHGVSFAGHTDPRLNLLVERGTDPLLRLTGATPSCQSVWADAEIFDMVGNLDEWIDDPAGTFVGGFYARSTREGCEAKITAHSAEYYDYSLGTRCCSDL